MRDKVVGGDIWDRRPPRPYATGESGIRHHGGGEFDGDDAAPGTDIAVGADGDGHDHFAALDFLNVAAEGQGAAQGGGVQVIHMEGGGHEAQEIGRAHV